MSFPDQTYPNAGAYVGAYRDEIVRAWASVDLAAFDRAAAMLATAIRAGQDPLCLRQWRFGIDLEPSALRRAEGQRRPTPSYTQRSSASPARSSWSPRSPTISAMPMSSSIRCARWRLPGDVLITISSSGNSENIVRAIEWARSNGVGSIAMTGFAGGRSKSLADVNLHVAAENYGVVEDIHQSMMHCLAQYLRQSAMPAELVPRRVF